jgi:hypothetical protein
MKKILLYYLIALAISFAPSCYSDPMQADSDIEVNTAIRHLDRHITALEQFNTKNKQLKLLPYKMGNRFLFIDEVVEFTHDLLRICVKKMLTDESLDPLFVVWRLFVNEYKDIDSIIFLREMAALLLSIYKNIFVAYLNNRSAVESKVDLAFLREIIELYQKVNTLPIKELLNTLDRCLDQFLEIMRDYGIDEDTSWIEWLKKHWWIPPVVATSVLVSIVQAISYVAQPTV